MATYKRQRYLLMTTDPVHIGTGGYRLGRVDLSIVREPGTRVPKIPGTSLHGAVRSYAAQLYETPEAAGQNQDRVQNPDLNPVCYTFGYIKKQGNGNQVAAYSGVVSICDAHVLLFPVHSMVGPVWVSTVERLRDAGIKVTNVPQNWQPDQALLTWSRSEPLNVGWLMVGVAEGQVILTVPANWQSDQRWQTIANRIVLVHESLFSHIVNSNLEVRTSVSINPQTGAAEEGALFTYEAIPRATFLTTEVILDDYRDGSNGRPFPTDKTDKGKSLPGGEWKTPLDIVRAGFRLMEWLGVGGMGTRGFGRVAVVGDPVEEQFCAAGHDGQGGES
jgi:CRISPR-associated protein Cmr4